MKLIDKKVVGLQVFLFLCMGSFEILTPYAEGVIINQFIHKEASLFGDYSDFNQSYQSILFSDFCWIAYTIFSHFEVSDNLNVETIQYDYYNNDNNMYDNLDYRDLQDQFDLLGVTKNNWD